MDIATNYTFNTLFSSTEVSSVEYQPEWLGVLKRFDKLVLRDHGFVPGILVKSFDLHTGRRLLILPMGSLGNIVMYDIKPNEIGPIGANCPDALSLLGINTTVDDDTVRRVMGGWGDRNAYSDICKLLLLWDK